MPESDLTPSQMATRWFLRLRQGALTADEHARFDAWHSESANEAALRQVAKLWNAVDEVAIRPEILQLRERILGRMNRRRLYVSGGIAAAVSALVAAGLVFLASQSPSPLMAALTAPSQGTFATTIGERSTVTLRDGSVLTLNTDSAAQVAYSETERTITLTRGQALFEVAKGESRPFVVYAGDRKIVATGTEFDVRFVDATVEVTLVEGHVHVDSTSLSGPSSTPVKAELSPGEHLIARAGAVVSVGTANVERATSWTKGKLLFVDTRLADAVTEANRYTQIPIRLADDTIADLRINGVFRVAQPGEFARAVAQIYPLAIDYRPDGQILIAAKHEP